MDSYCLAMHGLPADAGAGLPEARWEAQVHPDDLAGVHQAMNAAITTRSVFRMRYRTRSADGRHRWVLGLGNLVAEGAARFVGLAFDVTASMEAATELQRVRADYARLSRLGS